jgi:hypothetical protein
MGESYNDVGSRCGLGLGWWGDRGTFEAVASWSVVSSQSLHQPIKLQSRVGFRATGCAIKGNKELHLRRVHLRASMKPYDGNQ